MLIRLGEIVIPVTYLPAVLGSPVKVRVVERLLRRGPATIGEISRDIQASRQQVGVVVDELRFLGVLIEQPGEDRRMRVVGANEEHPFIEPLRILAVDAAGYYERPEAWQQLLSRQYGEDWYVGGYAAIRRVMQPIDFEDPHVLVNLAQEADTLDVPAILERAAGVKVQVRKVNHVPPEVLPVAVGDRTIWFATPERGFVESWRLKEVPLYGLLLVLVQGLHDRVLDPGKLLAVAAAERAQADIETLLAHVHERHPLRDMTPPPARRALKAPEREALEHALNTVVG